MAAPSDFSNYAVLPYINGISQPQTRLLQQHDIQVVSKPFKTLLQEFPSRTSRPPIDLQPNVVYKKYLVLASHLYYLELYILYTVSYKLK